MEKVEKTEKVEIVKVKTEYEKLHTRYNNLLSHYRGAVRWLREAHAYKRTFEAQEHWGAEHDIYKWLKKDGLRAFREIYLDIKKIRKKMDIISERLMDIKSKEKKNA